MQKITLLLLLTGCWCACQNEIPATSRPVPGPREVKLPIPPETVAMDTIVPQTNAKSRPAQTEAAGVPPQHNPTDNSQTAPARNGFTELTTLAPSVRLDIRYATTNNFTKAKIYDCPRCLLRPEAATAIAAAQKALEKQGLGLKMFDCYRPRPYQQRLWDKVPDANYVTPPAKGSMHSRGAAVDLTIIDAKGQELDMGTPYDFFGTAAHTDRTDLPAKVLANRRLLRETLEAVGFKGIRTEWWHFSYQKQRFPLSDYVWPCL